MKRFAKTAVCLLLCTALIFPSLPAFAQQDVQKDEVVYVNLSYEGGVDQIYVVNSFETSSAAVVKDYGDYTDIKNLTSEDTISPNGSEISLSLPQGKFYYQGTLNTKSVPWNISILYRLNGQPIQAQDLAGKSGKLEIAIQVRQNPDVDPVFFEHFALQASLTLNGDLCQNIQAPEATIANVGKNKTLSYILLPGKEKDLTISADVTDFEMDSIQINGIPLTLSIDKPDTSGVTQDLNKLQDGAVELDDGAKDLYDGVSELNDGAGELYSGVWELLNGTDDIKSGLADFYHGARDFESGVSQFSSSLNTLNQSSALVKEGLTGMYNALSPYLPSQGGGEEGSGGEDGSGGEESGIGEQIAQLQTLLTQLGTNIQSIPDTDENAAVKQELADTYTNFSQLLLAMLEQLAGGSEPSDPSQAIGLLAKQYAELYQGAMQIFAGYEAFAQQFSANIPSGADSLADGAEDLYAGFEEFQDGVKELFDGTSDLKDGTQQLLDGVGDLSDGTGELRDKTSDMDSQIDEEIQKIMDEYTGEDFTMVSFADARNTDINAVQFAMKTPAIQKEEAVQTQAEETPEPSFWDRLLALFGIQ